MADASARAQQYEYKAVSRIVQASVVLFLERIPLIMCKPLDHLHYVRLGHISHRSVVLFRPLLISMHFYLQIW